MVTRRGSLSLLAFLVLVALIGCPAQSTPPATQPPPAQPPPEPAVQPAPVPAVVAPDPIEQGFKHCCGNASHRIEINCGGMVKRCYSNETGSWRQTYGRHCLASLGQACYLEKCDAHCQ